LSTVATEKEEKDEETVKGKTIEKTAVAPVMEKTTTTKRARSGVFCVICYDYLFIIKNRHRHHQVPTVIASQHRAVVRMMMIKRLIK
jgi:hypothetical protein